MKTIRYTLLFLILAFALNFYAENGNQECKTTFKIIKGTYKGTNPFFQNNLANGIQKIYLNNKEVVSSFSSTVFELPLAGLKSGQKFELKIVYCSGAKNPYKIINPESIK